MHKKEDQARPKSTKKGKHKESFMRAIEEQKPLIEELETKVVALEAELD